MRTVLLGTLLIATSLTGCAKDSTVVLHDRFDDATMWKVGPVSDPNTTCGAVALGDVPSFVLALDMPQNAVTPSCLGTRLDSFDLSGMDAAWLTVSYDVSSFDLGGTHDQADLLVSAQAGQTAVQEMRSWRGGYDDGPTTGEIALDLDRLTGSDEPVHIVLGLRLFACPNVAAADCGIGSRGPVPAVRFDDLLLEALPAAGPSTVK